MNDFLWLIAAAIYYSGILFGISLALATVLWTSGQIFQLFINSVG